MPNSPDKPNHSEHWSDKLLFSVKFRLVLAFVLGMGVGAAIIKRASEVANPTNKPDVTEIKPADSGSDALHNKGLTSSQCRRLLAEVTGNQNYNKMSDDEIESRAHQIETERRRAKAEEIIKTVCVTNEHDRDNISNAVMSGLTKLDKIYEGVSGEWYISLDDSEGKNSDSFKLNEEPPMSCRPKLTEKEREKIEKDKEIAKEAEALAGRLKNNQWKGLLGDVDINQVIYEVSLEGLSSGLGRDLIDMLRRVESEPLGEMDSAQSKNFACELESFLANTDGDYWSAIGMDPAQKEAIKKMNDNAIIKNALKKFEIFAHAFSANAGLEKLEECLLSYYTRRNGRQSWHE